MTLRDAAGAAFPTMSKFRRSSWPPETASLSLSSRPYPITQEDAEASDWVLSDN